MEQLAVRLWQDEEGQTLTEYALLLVLVSLVAVSSMKNLASSMAGIYSHTTAVIVGNDASRPANNSHLDFQLKSSSFQSQWRWHFRSEHPKMKVAK